MNDTPDSPSALAAALGYVPTDPAWEPTSRPPIPSPRFGRDHWSTFAYVENRAVEHHGHLEHDQMRCDSDRHPMLYAAKRRVGAVVPLPDVKYPTRLKSAERRDDGTWGSEELPNHDDYDCLDDLVAAGLLTVHMPRRAEDRDVYVDAHGRPVTARMLGHIAPPPIPSFTTGMDEQTLQAAAVWALTDLGWRVAGELRAYKADGGNFHQFESRHLEQD